MTNSDLEESLETRPSRAWLFFMYLFLIFDYGRPQDSIKIVGYLHPAMVVVIILTIFLLANFGKIDFKIPQIKILWFFIFLLAAHVPFAINNHAAFNTTRSILLFMPFILSFIICVDSVNQFKKAIIVLICLMVYQAQYAVTHGGMGTGNQFLDENDFALYINTWLPFCFALFLSTKNIIAKILFGIFSLLGLGAVVISFSRGGFLGLIGMVVIYWLFSSKKLLMLVFLILGAVTVIYVSNLASHGRISHQKKGSFLEEMSSSTDAKTGTGRERVESWKSGWNMFLHNPLGVGGGNFPVRFSEYQTSYFTRFMWGRQAHSLWFTLIPELGIFGIAIYAWLLMVNIKHIFRLRKYSSFFDDREAILLKNLSVAFLASLAGYFVSATFISVLYYAHYWYLTGIIASANLIVTEKMNEIESSDPSVA